MSAVAGLGPGSAVYSPLPFFHTSALFTGIASALHASVPIGSRARFSASRTMPDIRRMGATMLTYTGKVLNYILAVPPSPDDATSPLRLAIGNEASESDIRNFAARFHCQVRDSYGSTEGMIIIRRDESMPRGSIGRADDSIAIYDPDTGRECPRADLDGDGRLRNADAAVGEIVNTAPGDGFEGYYRNEEARASKVRGGIYWSGDLAYRDADGWFFFAGRSNCRRPIRDRCAMAAAVSAHHLTATVGRTGRRMRLSGRRPGREKEWHSPDRSPVLRSSHWSARPGPSQ